MGTKGAECRMNALGFKLRVFVLIFLGIMLLGSIGFMRVERLSTLDAFYFSIVTIATVGYGDICPATGAGKILAIILIIGGVGTFLGLIANATDILMNRREEKIRHQKINMVVGLFFSELGSNLLRRICSCDPEMAVKQGELTISNQWTDRDFARKGKQLQRWPYQVDVRPDRLPEIKSALEQKTDLLLRLLENPILLEHNDFTDLLRAVFHLRDELINRISLAELPQSDYEHLAGDMKRVYALLTREWLSYMKYMSSSYPYLFALAVRTNPFDPEASAVVHA